MCCMVEVSFITKLKFILWKPPKMRLFVTVKKNGDTEVVLKCKVSRCDDKEANLQCCLAHQFSKSFPGSWKACIKQESINKKQIKWLNPWFMARLIIHATKNLRMYKRGDFFQWDSISILVSRTMKYQKFTLLYFRNETRYRNGNLYKDLLFVYL